MREIKSVIIPILIVSVIAGILVYCIGIIFTELYRYKEPLKTKTGIEINAQKRDDCIENGFDYEFVNEFWYIGVRCKKPDLIK